MIDKLNNLNLSVKGYSSSKELPKLAVKRLATPSEMQNRPMKRHSTLSEMQNQAAKKLATLSEKKNQPMKKLATLSSVQQVEFDVTTKLAKPNSALSGSEKSSISYENLLIAPFKLVGLLELTVEKKINEHGKLYLKGIIPEEDKDKYINSVDTQVDIRDGESGKVIFRGRIMEIRVNLARGVHYIEVDALSNTYELDLKIKKRSFQNMNLNAIVTKVLSGYSADFIASVSGDVGKILLQYNETDWEFLKRIASKLEVGLVSDSTSPSTRFWMGVPTGKSLGNIDKFSYSIGKDVEKFKHISRNSSKSHNEKDFINYEIETGEIFAIGDMVTFEGKTLSICEAYSDFDGAVLKSKYKLCPKKGTAKKPTYNKNIIGLSLEGTVTSVSADKVKVHLRIDESSGSYQFSYSSPYTAEGSGGWYAMPEVGDTVYVYFPDDKEESAFSTLSLRKDGGGVGDPSTKSFKTKSGMELIFSPSEILITTGGTLIKLSDGAGVEITTPSNVSINAGGDMNINAAGKLIMSAGGKLELSCNASQIKMAGDIVITGNDVKLN